MKRSAICLLTAAGMLCTGLAATAQPTVPVVGQAVRHDTSPPLREMGRMVQPDFQAPNREIAIHLPPNLEQRFHGEALGRDPLRQETGDRFQRAAPTPAPMTNFMGLSDDDNSALLGFRIVPPDTEGDVGPNHYVQMINLIFAVYDKATGNIVPGGGPFANNALWAGFGGICETNNDGDPIVLYDHLADRWMFSQFAIGSTGHQCFAVSTSGDPLGPYNRYDFEISAGLNGFNDYPKIGIWEDGYYLSANEFGGAGGSFQGAIAVAFEKDQMMAGGPAQFVKFGPLECTTICYFSLQPSHIEGPAAPAGAPNTFVMAFDDEVWGAGGGADTYEMWEFAVDWNNPGASTFSQLPAVTTSEFDAELCNFSRSCVPQPSPGESLDTLGQFTMYRAQYRNFGSHETIVLNHTVDVGGNLAGIRWSELRNAGSGWGLHQTGTYSPGDGVHRWMASAAMDGSGNIALGYNASSGSVFPSVRYNSREAADPLGTLPGGEVELIAGSGVQQSSSNRWGDYSSLSLDPVDDCTFWVTGEYYENNGSFDFKTRIGSFKLPSCGVSQECGNGIVEGTEVCDGGDLGGETCQSQGCGGGTLACNATCDGYDLSGCFDCPVCDNDGVCEAGEDCDTCPNDCVSGMSDGAVCGNGICEAGNGEDCLSCAADCNGRQNGRPANRFCCGDGDGQNPVDCSDARCSTGGFLCTNDPVAGGSFCCGDMTCDAGESCANCALDCNLGFEVCDDGVDNDCNGLADCDDGACSGDPACVEPPCGDKGASCSVGADCCSGVCKRNGTCR